MTALIHTHAVADTQGGGLLAEIDALAVGLDDFLRDPIGYGDYDFTDPMSLSEFSSRHHMHGLFVAVMT